MKFEDKLKLLFDYQKFENNTELEKIISNFIKQENELTEIQLAFVNGGKEEFHKKEYKKRDN